VFAVPRSTAIALAGKSERDLKNGQRIIERIRRSERNGSEGKAGGPARSAESLVAHYYNGKALA
jgi:hypothetical protein